MAEKEKTDKAKIPKKKKQFFGTQGFLDAVRKRQSLLEEASK